MIVVKFRKSLTTASLNRPLCECQICSGAWRSSRSSGWNAVLAVGCTWETVVDRSFPTSPLTCSNSTRSLCSSVACASSEMRIAQLSPDTSSLFTRTRQTSSIIWGSAYFSTVLCLFYIDFSGSSSTCELPQFRDILKSEELQNWDVENVKKVCELCFESADHIHTIMTRTWLYEKRSLVSFYWQLGILKSCEIVWEQNFLPATFNPISHGFRTWNLRIASSSVNLNKQQL